MAPSARPCINRQPSLASIPEDEECSYDSGGDQRQVQGNNKPAHHLLTFRAPPPARATNKVINMVNEARESRSLPPLTRVKALDQLAKKHVKAMVREQAIFHSVSTPDQLKRLLESDCVAENILRGASLGAIYDDVLSGRQAMSRRNMLHNAFDETGYAVRRDEQTGIVYLCQVFRKSASSAARKDDRNSRQQQCNDSALLLGRNRHVYAQQRMTEKPQINNMKEVIRRRSTTGANTRGLRNSFNPMVQSAKSA